jgi:hypothetical protein
MDASIFAEWLRRQGHHVVQSVSIWWYDAAPFVYQAFPYHWVVQPDESELHQLFLRNRVLCIRYSTGLSSPFGCISYHAVCLDKGYSLDSLDRRARQNVRSGMKNCLISALPLEQVADEGWGLEGDTCNRQGRNSQYTRELFRKRILSARDLPGFEAWGAVIRGRLAAFILAIKMGETMELLSQACGSEFMKLRVNNALAFAVTREFMTRQDITAVFYTLQSLDAPASVDEFKFRMGYSAKPIRQRVVFHPFLSFFLNKLSYAGLRQLRKFWPYKPYLTKAEGMARFYLSGKASASEQDWPECLSANKAELLNKLVDCSGEEPGRISSK